MFPKYFLTEIEYMYAVIVVVWGKWSVTCKSYYYKV